jgi:hypothetical protein
VILVILLLLPVVTSAETGVWITREEIMRLPMFSASWDAVVDAASESTSKPNVSEQDDSTDTRVLAKAFVYARTGHAGMREDVIDACRNVIGTETGARTLALGRGLMAYVIAADLVGLPSDLDNDFRAWLRELRTREFEGKTLISTHELRPNNWGTHAGASRLAIAVYLGDQDDLARAAKVFHGWLGARNVYAGFKYGDLSWQSDSSRPVGINPRGAIKNGRSVDGVLPDDQRRGGGFGWPAARENYVWDALQGALAQAVILHRAGYDVWNWEDRALLRAVQWLYEVNDYAATGDDSWQPHVINHYYGEHFSARIPSRSGKNVGYTDWTHGASARPPLIAPRLLRLTRRVSTIESQAE